MKITIDHSDEYSKELCEMVRSLEDNENLEKIEIIPSDRDIFRVSLNSKVILDLEEDEFSVDKIVEAISEEAGVESG